MKKIMVVFLSITLALSCFGLSGCAGVNNPIISDTEMIAKLEEKLDTETYASAIDYKGGFKISVSATVNDEAVLSTITAKKAGESVNMMFEGTIGAKTTKSYMIDGFMIEPTVLNPLKYHATEYFPLSTALFGLSDMVMGDGSGQIAEKEVVGVDFSTLDGGFSLTKQMEISGVPGESIYTFNSDLKITSAENIVYNSSIKTQISFVYGAQEFDIPAAALAVKLDTPVLQAKKICGDVSVAVAKSGYLAAVGGIKVDIQTGLGQETNNQSVSIKGDEFLMETDETFAYAKGCDLYSGQKNKDGVFEVEYNYDSLHSSQMASMMMLFLAQNISIDAIIQGGNDLSVVTTGKNTKISCGESYIDINDGKMSKTYLKLGEGESAVEVITTMTYGITVVPPQGVKDYVKTKFDDAAVTAYERLKNFNLTNIRKQKGLKVVVTDTAIADTTTTITIDFAKYYDQAQIDVKVGEETSAFYQYKSNIYQILNENVVKDTTMEKYDEIVLQDFLDNIESQEEITVTDKQVIFSNKAKTNVTTIDIIKGGLITKVEIKNESGTKTITYTYGAQTVKVPQQIVDEANKKIEKPSI